MDGLQLKTEHHILIKKGKKICHLAFVNKLIWAGVSSFYFGPHLTVSMIILYLINLSPFHQKYSCFITLEIITGS